MPSLSGPPQHLPPMSGSFEPPPPPLQVKLLSSSAKPPTRSSAFAAGYDMYASKAASVPAWGKVMVDTDISIAVPAGTYGRVAPRSGLASKHSIHTGAGVIDADYRGPVKVLLFNLSGEEFRVESGDRIAQLIVERVRCLHLILPMPALLSLNSPPLCHLLLPLCLSSSFLRLLLEAPKLTQHRSTHQTS